MARKDSTNPPATRGFNDTIGIALIASALLLLVALVTYDRQDSSDDYTSPNIPTHNLGGKIGGFAADKAIKLFGAGAYILVL